jgi:hypothetical protein
MPVCLPLTFLGSNGYILQLKCLVATNALAYHAKELITTVKRCMACFPGLTLPAAKVNKSLQTKGKKNASYLVLIL